MAKKKIDIKTTVIFTEGYEKDIQRPVLGHWQQGIKKEY